MLALITMYEDKVLVGTQHASSMTEARTLLLIRGLLPTIEDSQHWEHKYENLSARIYPLDDGVWDELQRQGEDAAPSIG
jgi:hypothetical protein